MKFLQIPACSGLILPHWLRHSDLPLLRLSIGPSWVMDSWVLNFFGYWSLRHLVLRIEQHLTEVSILLQVKILKSLRWFRRSYLVWPALPLFSATSFPHLSPHLHLFASQAFQAHSSILIWNSLQFHCLEFSSPVGHMVHSTQPIFWKQIVRLIKRLISKTFISDGVTKSRSLSLNQGGLHLSKSVTFPGSSSLASYRPQHSFPVPFKFSLNNYLQLTCNILYFCLLSFLNMPTVGHLEKIPSMEFELPKKM